MAYKKGKLLMIGKQPTNLELTLIILNLFQYKSIKLWETEQMSIYKGPSVPNNA